MRASRFSARRWLRCAKSRGQTSSRWMGRRSKPKSVTPGLSSRMAGPFVCRPAGCNGTREKSGTISGPSKSMTAPVAKPWIACGVMRTSLSAFTFAREIIAPGGGAGIFSPLRGMPAGCRNWPRNFRIAKSPFSFAATNCEPRTNFPDCRLDWAPGRRWEISTPWPDAIIFSDPSALFRNGLPFTAISRCFS